MSGRALARATGRCRPSPGFTLIELMVVVAIIAILAAIALPSYRRHVLHANRAAAESLMMEIASAQERYLIDKRSYGSLDDLGYGTQPVSVSANYKLDMTVSAGPPPSYSITATAQGSQAADTGCTKLTLGGDGSKGPTTGCWK
nr:type IV pilin protein [Frateuria defendens]